MRAVEDHHVDRSGVDVQQCMKLTDTNSSIDLIPLICQCSFFGLVPAGWVFANDQTIPASSAVIRWLGGYGGGPKPDPIPNSAVKPPSADGTPS